MGFGVPGKFRFWSAPRPPYYALYSSNLALKFTWRWGNPGWVSSSAGFAVDGYEKITRFCLGYHKNQRNVGKYTWILWDNIQINRFPRCWFQIFLMFFPETWGRFPIWRAYFSNGLVQPPTRKRLWYDVVFHFVFIAFETFKLRPNENDKLAPEI